MWELAIAYLHQTVIIYIFLHLVGRNKFGDAFVGLVDGQMVLVDLAVTKELDVRL